MCWYGSDRCRAQFVDICTNFDAVAYKSLGKYDKAKSLGNAWNAQKAEQTVKATV